MAAQLVESLEWLWAGGLVANLADQSARWSAETSAESRADTTALPMVRTMAGLSAVMTEWRMVDRLVDAKADSLGTLMVVYLAASMAVLLAVNSVELSVVTMADWSVVPRAEWLALQTAERMACPMAAMKAVQWVETSVGSTVGHLEALWVDSLVGKSVVQ